MSELDKDKQEEFKKFIENNPVSFNSQRHWIEFIEEEFDYKNRSFFVYNIITNKMEAFCPLFVVKSWLFGNKLISSPFLDNGGLFTALNYDDRILCYQRIQEIAHEEKVDYIEIRNPVDKPIDYIETNQYCDFVMDLDTEKVMFSKIDKKLRNIIRKAQTELTYEVTSIEQRIDMFYDMYLKTMQHLRSPPLPKSFYLNFKNDHSYFIFAYHNYKPVGCILMVGFKDSVKYEANVYLPEYKRLNANSFLLWEAMKLASLYGGKKFYFGRTLKDSSVYHYKKQWNAKELSYPFYYRMFKGNIPSDIRSGLVKKLSFVWSVCPRWLTSLIGWRFRKMIGS